MRRWYQATCVVRLGSKLCIHDGTGENEAVSGYVMNMGLSGVDMSQAMMEAERIALAQIQGSSDGNRVEEAKIKEIDLPTLREIFQIEEKGAGGDSVFRSALIYFDE